MIAPCHLKVTNFIPEPYTRTASALFKRRLCSLNCDLTPILTVTGYGVLLLLVLVSSTFGE